MSWRFRMAQGSAAIFDDRKPLKIWESKNVILLSALWKFLVGINQRFFKQQ